MALPFTIDSSHGVSPGYNPPHVRETITTTYYFDASVSGPTDAQGVWTSDANGFNGGTATQTSSTTTTSPTTNRLIGKGTTAPGTGGTITSVKCRVFQQGLYVSGTVTGNGRIEVRDSSDTEELGFIATPLGTNFGPGWSDYKTLTAPSGGWSWTELQNLIVEFAPISGGSWEYNVSKVEIAVTEVGRAYYAITTQPEYGTPISSAWQLRAEKATDPSASWTEQDNANRPSGTSTTQAGTTYPVVSSVNDGNYIHIVSLHEGELQLEYHRFNMSTDSWDVTNVLVADLSGMSAPDSSVLWCDIAYRSGVTDELVVAASGLTDSDMGSSYQRVDLWHADQAVTTAGGWTGPIAFPDTTTARSRFQAKSVVDSSGKVYYHYHISSQSDPITLHFQTHGNNWLTSDAFENTTDNEWGGVQSSTSYALLSGSTVVNVNDGTNERQWAPRVYEDAASPTVAYITGTRTTNGGGSTDVNENVSTSTSAHSNGEVGVVTAVEDGGTFYTLWSGGGTLGADQDIYISESTDYGDTWSSATEILDAVTVNAISAAVLDSGKIAYLYDDGGTTKYNEYSLSSDVTVDAGPEALQITENPATVTNPTNDVNVDAGPEALQVQENAAEIAVDVNVDSGPEALQVEEFTATVELDQNIDVNTEQLQVQENIATVALDVDIDAGPEALSVEEHIADIQYGVNVLATEEQLQVAENQATLTFDVDVEAGPEALQVEEHQATVFKDTNVSANTEQLQVQEFAASVTLPVDISANTEQLQIQEFPAEFTFNVDVPAGPEQLQVTTLQASLGTDTNVDAGPEQLSVTENAATLTYDVDVQGVEEQISLDTQPATLVYDVDVLGNVEQLQVDTLLATIDTTSDTFVNGNVESLSLQTYPASLSEDENINTNVEQLQLQEFSATLTYDQIIISGPEQLQVAGQQATLTYNVDVNSGPETLQVDTQQAVITAPNQDTNVDGQVEQLQVSTSQAIIGIDVETSVGTQSISLEEYPATLDFSQNIESNTEQLEVNANTATIGYQRNLGTVVEQLQLSTIAASIRLDSGRTAAKINNVDIPQIA